jgi:hypothetical protein
MKQDLKLRLEYSFCEALVYDVEERIGLGMYEPEDKLLFAVLHEFIMQVKRKMLVYQKQYVTKVKATQSI